MNSKNLHKHALPVIMIALVGTIGLTAATANLSRSYFSFGSTSLTGLLGSAVHVRASRSGLADVTFRVDNPTLNNYSLQSESGVADTLPTIFAFQNAAKSLVPAPGN